MKSVVCIPLSLLFSFGCSQPPERSELVLPIDNYAPDWSPDGSALVYIASNYRDKTSDIVWLSLADGETRVLAQRLRQANRVCVSPDGEEVLVSTGFAADPDQGLYLVGVEGGIPQRIGNLQGREACWSPDGSRLVFSSKVGDRFQLFISNLQGEAVQITYADSDQRTPYWSPDGEHIFFDSVRESEPQIFRIRPDGRDETQITEQGGESAALSRDGRRVAFVRRVAGDYEIFTANADGADAQQTVAIPRFDGGPAWSPDGTQLVWGSDRAGNFELVMLDLNTEHLTQLTRQPAGVVHLIRTLMEEGSDAAYRQFRRVRSAHPDAVLVNETRLLNMARSFGRSDRKADAVTTLRIAVESFPDSAGSHMALARQYSELGDNLRAVELFRRADALAPDDWAAREALLELGVSR